MHLSISKHLFVKNVELNVLTAVLEVCSYKVGYLLLGMLLRP